MDGFNMSAHNVMRKVKNNDSRMGNSLPKTIELNMYDHCCGIHGAARERKGIKKGTNAARRRYEKEIIRSYIDELE